jgi:excisionase family DNA binding protein
MNNDMFTIPKAAEYCSVSRGTLWRYVKSGNLKAFLTPGGHHRILKKDLESFMHEKGMLFPDSTDHSKGKILVVDDDPKTQKYLNKMLSSSSYHIETASDGFEAGAKTIQFKPDLIILDLFMPGLDGFEVCKQIKENSNTSQIKILVLTGFDTQENRDRILQLGADGYLAKPVKQSLLIQNIKNLLGKNTHFIKNNI